MSSHAEVFLWGSPIGAVALRDGDTTASFEYDPAFVQSGTEPAPLTMPLASHRVYRFPALSEQSFKGLPGMLADSLPDRFGNALIDVWLATRGETPADFDAVRRLCYLGQRGMGALEFKPALGPRPTTSHQLDVGSLVELAADVLSQRADLTASLNHRREAMREILRVGTSAGGARAKALVALDPATGEVRSGQMQAEERFEQWILKFDGVDDSSRELGTGQGYGVVEWVYSQMAKLAGIEMAPCRLLDEGGHRHFMTRRFDRDSRGRKLHMQSLAAIAHLDFEQAGAHSYEQAFQVAAGLGLPPAARLEQFRRMVFNVVARNQDDHVKNIAFLMDRQGEWSLSPAFDVVYAFNPRGRQTRLHQMSLNGKRDGFTLADLRKVGTVATLKRSQADDVLAQVTEAVAAWPRLAAEAGLDEERVERIERAHRLRLPRD